MAEKWLIFKEIWLSCNLYLVLIEWPLFGFQGKKHGTAA